MADSLMINGVPIGDAGAAAFVAATTRVLRGGQTAEIRKGKGRDVIRVMSRAMSETREGDLDVARMMFLLVAELVRLDGNPITIEDLEEMDVGDTLTLMGEALGANFTLPLPGASPLSSSGGSPSAS
jgi:hypothetical protein